MSTPPLIAVLDYGIGNLRSAQKALQRCGADARLTVDHRLIADADAVVLPGVGAFGACMYQQAVEVAKEHIVAGDIFQVVLAQRYDIDLEADPFDFYRVLRQVNPSPYMSDRSPCCHAAASARSAATRPEGRFDSLCARSIWTCTISGNRAA